MSAKETSESQRRAYQRDGRLGRAYPNEMGNKPKPKYQTAPPPKPPRKGGDNIDKGYKSSNPAKNRAYPGTVGQMSKALEKAYERGRADGARMVGAKTTSIKGRIPVVRQVRQNKISPIDGRPIPNYSRLETQARTRAANAMSVLRGGTGVGRGGSRSEFRTGGGGGGEGGILKKKIR